MALERTHFQRVCRRFRSTAELGDCISGSAQFFSIDDAYRDEGVLPVICLVGVNYTQEPKRESPGLVHYSDREPPTVTRSTATRRQPRFVVAAYNRNQAIWETKQGTHPVSPLGAYGARNATAQSGLTSVTPDEVGLFALMMTNVTPFITQNAWQRQVRQTPAACKALTSAEGGEHLDDLFERLGDSIDLWIGHSAIAGTEWVWPHFADFVRRHGIKSWLLCGNINAQAHLWHDRAFRKPLHRLYSWYK